MSSFPYLLLKKQMPLMPSESKKVWKNPYHEEVKATPRSFERNTFFKESPTLKRKSHFQEATSSQIQHLKTEVDPEIIHEVPYMDYLISRTKPRKLDKLMKKIESEKNPRSLSFKRPIKRVEEKPEESRENISNVQGYLEYLNCQSDRSLKSFRQRMIQGKSTEMNNQTLSARWNDDYNPKTEAKVIKKENPSVTSASLSTLKPEKPEKERASSKPQSTILPFPEKEKPAYNSPRKTKLVNSQSSQTLIKPEIDQNILSAQRLSEEIANNYRLCKEKALKNRELLLQLANYLDNVGVREVFQARGEKAFLPLSTRIYSQLIENVESFEPENFNASDKKSKNRSVVQFRPRVILHRFNLFEKVNEKLLDLNIQYRVQGLQNLEVNLFQAHEDFKSQKEKTIKHISRAGQNRIQGVVSQCFDEIPILPQFQANLSREHHFGTDTPTFDEMSKTKKEIRLVNLKLSQVLTKWQKSLFNPQ